MQRRNIRIPSLATPAGLISIGTLSLVSTTASAGGVGVLATAGLHTERAYYYNAEGDQGIDNQTVSNTGIGMEGVLGDRDDKIQGVLRLYWLRDAPPSNPDTLGVKNAEFPDYDSLEPEDVGVAEIGVQWGLLGDPDGLQLTVTSFMGTGFLTVDNTEFFLADVGVGGTYVLADHIQAFANVAANVRHRKVFSYGPSAYAGIRYLFD